MFFWFLYREVEWLVSDGFCLWKHVASWMDQLENWQVLFDSDGWVHLVFLNQTSSCEDIFLRSDFFSREKQPNNPCHFHQRFPPKESFFGVNLRGIHHKNRKYPKVTWENRAPKDWQVAFVPWWWFGFLCYFLGQRFPGDEMANPKIWGLWRCGHRHTMTKRHPFFFCFFLAKNACL